MPNRRIVDVIEGRPFPTVHPTTTIRAAAQIMREWHSSAILVVVDTKQKRQQYQERLGPILMRMRLDELFGAVSKLPDAFKEPEKPLGLEKPLMEGMVVEVVKP